MLDINFIRENPQIVKDAAKNKNIKIDVDELLSLDESRRKITTEIDELRAKRNTLSSEMKNQKPSPEQIEAGKKLKDEIAALEQELQPVEEQWLSLMKAVPNIPASDVPIGGEENNKIIKTVGEPQKFSFKPKSDAELGLINNIIDKERAAKVAGSRFAYIKGGLVLLQFAIINFVMDTLTDEPTIAKLITENGLKLKASPFIPILPPYLLKTGIYDRSARLNREEVTYKLADDDLWLQASAEHPLCTMYADETLKEEDLPIRYIGYATSFRREAGTYGKDMEGIFRMHQFDKLEMETFSTAETSYDEHLLMCAIQEHLVTKLNLPYQVVLKATEDVGKPNIRGVDIETWMPSQNAYRETHTADYMGDYQMRRLNTKVKLSGGQSSLAHTNDATAFALGRIMKAVIENNQNEDGSINIPEVLRPYMGGRDKV